MTLLRILVLLVLVGYGRSNTTITEERDDGYIEMMRNTKVLPDNADIEDQKVEVFGDIRLTELTKNQFEQAAKSHKEQSEYSNDRRHLWHDKIAPYEIDSSISDLEHVIKEAFETIENNTCIRFVEKTNTTYQWIKFMLNNNNDKCVSDYGRQYKIPGPVEIWLDKYKCKTATKILHVLMHSLGFLNEVQRPDRENYIDIHWNNILQEDKEDMFKVLYKFEPYLTYFGLKYDTHSVTHYRSLDASKNRLRTVTALGDPQDNLNVGWRSTLSILDVLKMNVVYACQVDCSGTMRAVEAKELSASSSSKEYNTSLGYVEPNVNETKRTWCSASHYPYHKDYLQVELENQTSLCHLTTQGNIEHQAWVTKFALNYSVDGVQWNEAVTIDGLKTFQGNFDAHQAQIIPLSYPIQAKYVRFIPKSSHKRICMKVLLYEGEPQKRKTEWSGWSTCGRYTPGKCIKNRQRFCSPANTAECPNVDEHGVETQEQSCSMKMCEAPVNGHWGSWSSWSECQPKCGQGTANRKRKCDQPAPRFNGINCTGHSTQTRACHSNVCIKGRDGCSFMTNYCRWTNDPFLELKWVLKRKFPNGPLKDHSYSPADGYFLAIEENPKNYTSAILRSPLQPGTCGQRCISFYYYMNGIETVTLRILIQEGHDGKRILLKEITGDTGQQWVKESITFSYKWDYKILIQGINKSSLVNVAVDDIDLLWGPCDNATGYNPDLERPEMKPKTIFEDFCDFETSFCNWANADKHVDFNWTRYRGPTPTDFTGPSGDRSNNTSTGYYAYIETSQPREVGDRAQLVYNNLRTLYKSMSFWYYMSGDDVGQLRVFQRLSKTEHTLFFAHGSQGHRWINARVNLMSGTEPSTLIIEAVRGHGERGDIAIDDVVLGKQPVETKKPGRAVDLESILSLSNCSFDDEQHQCGWRDLREPAPVPGLKGSGNFYWQHKYCPELNETRNETRNETQSPSEINGYMYLNSSSPRNSGDVARLASLEIITPENSTTCFKYSSFMHGSGQKLNVYLWHPRLNGKIKTHKGEYNNTLIWERHSIAVNNTEAREVDFKIIFEGITADPGESHILLDDIEVIHDNDCT